MDRWIVSDVESLVGGLEKVLVALADLRKRQVDGGSRAPSTTWSSASRRSCSRS